MAFSKLPYFTKQIQTTVSFSVTIIVRGYQAEHERNDPPVW